MRVSWEFSLKSTLQRGTHRTLPFRSVWKAYHMAAQSRTLESLPHGGAVEVDHHPLGGVEGERLRVLHTRHEVPELGADERSARVRRVHVHPDAFLLA